jgi:Uma2 family endonuclease
MHVLTLAVGHPSAATTIWPVPDLHGMTVEEWHRSGGGMELELLDGQVIERPSMSGSHAVCVNRLAALLTSHVGDRAIVKTQVPVVLDERSEPRPDVAVMRPRSGGYLQSPASPEDLLLLVEVADDTTVTFDRGRKASYYAQSGVPECWIVDLAGDQVLRMRSPASGGYRDIRNLRRGSRVSVEALEGVMFDAAEVLGPEMQGKVSQI